MAITAASLLVKVGYDDSEVDAGLKNTEGRISTASAAIGSTVGNLAANVISQLPGAVYTAATGMEDAMAPIGTLLGFQSAEFDAYTANVKNLVANSPTSADELGRAAYDVLSAGIMDVDQATLALSESQKLAQAGLGQVPDAVDVITSSMSAFKNENLSGADAAKVLFGTMSIGKADLNDIAQGFGGIAPTAAAAGVSFQEMMGAVAAMTQTGLPASEVYTGLKATLSNVIKPTSEAAKLAGELGLEFNATALQSQGLSGFLDNVKNATGGNIETMAKLFGSTEAVGMVMALTGDQAATFKDAIGGVATAGEGLDAAAEGMSNTVSARFATMKNKSMVALGELGNKGFKLLFEVIDVLAPKVEAMKETVVGGFRALAAAFKANDGDITSSGFAGVMERIGLAAAQAVDFFKANWPVIKEVVGQVLDGLVALWTTEGKAILAIATALVTQVVAFFQERWPQIQRIISDVMTIVRNVITTAWPIIQQIIAQAVQVITTNILPALMTALGVVMDIVEAAVGIVKEHWPQIADIFQQVADIVLPIMEIIGIVVSTVVTTLAFLWKQFGDEITAVVSWAFGFILDVIGSVLDVVMGVVNTVLSLIKGDWSAAWDSMKQIIEGVWELIKTIVSGALEVLKTTLSLAWDGIKLAIDAAWEGIKSGISAALEGIKTLASDAWEAVKTKATDTLDGIVTFLTEMPGKIKTAASGMFDGIVDAFRGAINWLIDIWNGLSFTIGGQKVFGQELPGVTIDTPNMEHLAQGGIIRRAGLAMVGEQGPEVLSFPANAQVSPLPAGGAAGIGGNVTYITINMPPGSDGDDVVRALKDYERRNGRVPVRTAS
jgi:TP901 family phage tail tape measure protein